MKISRLIIFLLIGILISQSIFYYPNLPEIIFSHFNSFGKPDSSMSKSNFFIFEFVILLLIVAEFALLPKLIEKMPNALINLPAKVYWLTSERRNETFATIRQFFDWLSTGLLILFIAVNQLVFQANIKHINLPTTPMWTILGLFLIFVVIWLTFFVFRFRIKKDEN